MDGMTRLAAMIVFGLVQIAVGFTYALRLLAHRSIDRISRYPSVEIFESRIPETVRIAKVETELLETHANQGPTSS